MANVARIPITNIYGGDYTGCILVGAEQKPMNVLLDTGSSTLALDGTKYKPNLAGGDQTTTLAQTDSYGDNSSWTGAVIKTTLTIGDGDASVTLPNGNASIAYTASSDMFGETDGILGLAYAALDDAFNMSSDTWSNQSTDVQVRSGQHQTIQPYLTQLSGAGVVSDKISFLTKRSFPHVGGGDANDPLNQGWMIVGGGEESTDLYTDAFQTVKVLSQDWYSTNLKAVIVGKAAPIAARLKGSQGMPSNSIVDSGTNSLCLGTQMLNAFISKFTTAQQQQLKSAIHDEKLLDNSAINLADWPTITFVLQGATDDVRINVIPSDYWQVNSQQAGATAIAISPNADGNAILGLPLMNGYFCIFDGEADGGMGAIKFATKKV
jgi:hypothetical protein